MNTPNVAQLKTLITFEQLWDQGWHTLIPVIPPNVTMTALSKIPEDQRGKAPGVLYPQGWGGLADWQHIRPNRDEYRKWDRMGASLGCRCDELVAIDCDIPDKELSLAVLQAVRSIAFVGANAAFRVGLSPKWLLPLRMAGGFRGWNITFTHPRVADKFQVQFLGHGRQFVLWGVHPKTAQLYKWSSDQRPPVLHTLPAVDGAQLEALKATVVRTLEAQGAALVHSGAAGASSSAEPPNQQQLKGTQELIREALGAIPNDLDYDEWQGIAAAVRGASQDWPEEGLAAFLEFSSRCTRVAPDVGDAKRKYLSYHAPFRLGAQFLYDKAATYGFNKAAADFTPIPKTPAQVEQQQKDRESVRWGEEVQHVLPQTTSEQSRFADQAIAHRFIAEHREKLIYVGERGVWHAWDGQRWKPDTTRSVHELLLQQFLTREATRVKASAADTAEEQKEQAKLVKQLMSTTLHKNVAAQVRSPMTVSQDVLDRDPWALNTPGGLIDLRTGEPVTANRKRYITRLTKVAPAPPGTRPTRWLRFLSEVTQQDDELVSWLQRALGYTLSGELSEQVFFFLWGPGGNGKGVLINTVKELLGSYTTTSDRSVFLKTRFQEHSTVRASLAGARLISVPEMQASAEWNDALLKEFSAGDTVKARFIGRDEFEFIPQGTLWFSGNDRPTLAKIDPAIERRFRLVTFNFYPERPDIHLKQYLIEREGPAIMRWLLDGYLDWQRNGLGTAQAVEAGTAEYFADHDPIRSWIRDCCVLNPVERDGSSELFDSYLQWWKDNLSSGKAGEALNQTVFVQRLKAVKGVGAHRTMDKRWLTGIARQQKITFRAASVLLDI